MMIDDDDEFMVQKQPSSRRHFFGSRLKVGMYSVFCNRRKKSSSCVVGVALWRINRKRTHSLRQLPLRTIRASILFMVSGSDGTAGFVTAYETEGRGVRRQRLTPGSFATAMEEEDDGISIVGGIV
jgi:hypothetical protein